MRRMLRRLQYWLVAGRRERDLVEEIESHRRMLQDRLERSGMAPADAEAASRRMLGNLTLAREDARRVWIWPWLESAGQDFRYAMRAFRRAPSFALSIVLVMALGIGATTSVFSLVDRLVLESLPVRDPGRLVYFSQPSFSYPIFQQVRARGESIFSDVFAWNLDRLYVEWASELEATDVLTSSGDFFTTLGVNASVGRTFGPADDRIGGGDSGLVAVISYRCWQRRYREDPAAIGTTIRIEGKPFTIIGVTPAGFDGVAPGLAPEITIPLTSLADEDRLRAPFAAWVHIMARLRDGVSPREANAAVQVFWPEILEQTTSTDLPPDRRAVYLSRRTNLESARTGFSRVRNQFEEPLWMLLALVSLVLAVACGSGANLLLARGLARRRETAVRLAIGASRGRLVRQMLTEAAVWTIVASVVGIVLAAWAAGGLVGLMTTREERIVLDVWPGWRSGMFAIALAFATAAVCALLPALRQTQFDAAAELKSAGRSGTGRFRRWSPRSLLVISQVALALVLLAGAALFVRSLQRVLSEDAGIERDRVLVLGVEPMAAGYEGSRLLSFYDTLLGQLRSIPEVESASLSWYPPISNEDGAWTQAIQVDGLPAAATPDRTVFFNAVSPDYFSTMGMRMLSGRDFRADDSPSSPKVVIVNDALARRYLAGQNPIGRRISVGRNAARQNLEIVGVVSDSKYRRLQEGSASIAYLPAAQLAEMIEGENVFAEVRARGTLAPVAGAMRARVSTLDPRVPFRIETVTARIRESLVRERVIALLATTLGLVALVLASAALYGLLAYAVARQTKEIGVRMALGADRRSVLWMVVRDSLVLTGTGVACGLLVSVLAGRFVSSFLYQITPTDPMSLGAAALLMLVVSTAAGFLPARRAASVDPVVALRAD